jgi:hypothetical protein
MLKKIKIALLIFATTILFYNCSKDDTDTPKYLDGLVGSWSPVVGLMTGEIINGDYGEVSFTYNFGECSRENSILTFKEDGSLDFKMYRGNLDDGCTIFESSKNVVWESVGDTTFIAEGLISQLNNQGTYDDVDIYQQAEPYFSEPDLVKIKNDTLILFYDKIPKTNLYNTRFFYARSY